MSLTPQQISELKSQLGEQIEHLPEVQRIQAQEQIDNMSPEALEAMLKQQSRKSQKSVFRMIINNELPAKKIDENSSCIAVLEIRPASKGHLIIIPKNKVSSKNSIPTQAFSMAKKLAKKLKNKMKASQVEIQTEVKLGEQIINIIPQYKDPVSIASPRYEASEKELDEMYKILKVKQKIKVIRLNKKSSQKPSSSLPILKRRIP